MGRKGKDETVAKVLQAFLEQRTWRQAELARHVDVSPKRLRAILLSLMESRMPLERLEEHPHVYWSVPGNWFPGGIAVSRKEHADLLRCLLRLEAEPTRDALIGKIVRAVNFGTMTPAVSVGQAAVASDILSVIEDAKRDRTAVDIRYQRATTECWRTVTPAHIELRPRPRMVATCHNSLTLKWFRLERVTRAVASDCSPLVPAPCELAGFIDASVDGYYGAHAEELRFVVQAEEAEWVGANLPKGLKQSSVPEGLSVRGGSAGLVPLARFVTGLGGAVTSMSPSLAREVARLAAEALSVAEESTTSGVGGDLNRCPAGPNGRAGYGRRRG